jgi:hypothetical protein
MDYYERIDNVERKEGPMWKYDPTVEPDAEEWGSLGEGEQIEFVRQYHRRAKVKLPNANLHAVIHTIVENQIKLGDKTPVRRTIDRLQVEGLDRHDAIHAVGSILAEHMYDLIKSASDKKTVQNPNLPYWASLEGLTAENWRKRT